MNTEQKKKGLTLVELMIVIAIIGILAAITIPNLLSYQKRTYDSAALSEARNFYNTALAYLGTKGTGITLDVSDGAFPTGFVKNDDIEYSGSITYNDDGTTTGTMTFSHTKSNSTFTLNGDGSIDR
ncbi:Tfp pilus assembly protein, major pilin [Candidatus Magnetomoraceae bacterium gMMP-15]